MGERIIEELSICRSNGLNREQQLEPRVELDLDKSSNPLAASWVHTNTNIKVSEPYSLDVVGDRRPRHHRPALVVIVTERASWKSQPGSSSLTPSCSSIQYARWASVSAAMVVFQAADDTRCSEGRLHLRECSHLLERLLRGRCREY